MQIADVENDIDHVLLTKEQIDQKIAQTAALVDRDYAGRDVLLLGVLKGAANTMVALSSAMRINAQVDYMSITSYGGTATQSSGTITIRQDMGTDVAGRHVLIVEDIIDTGLTLDWLIKLLHERGAASVEVFALVSKPSRREVEVPVKYPGFDVPNEFVVGFGLDYDEKYRNLDSIAVLKPEVYKGEQA